EPSVSAATIRSDAPAAADDNAASTPAVTSARIQRNASSRASRATLRRDHKESLSLNNGPPSAVADSHLALTGPWPITRNHSGPPATSAWAAHLRTSARTSLAAEA